MDEFEKYMNKPEKPLNEAYKEWSKGTWWLCCPYCGKKQFTLSIDAVIKNKFQCRGSSCKKVFTADVKM